MEEAPLQKLKRLVGESQAIRGGHLSHAIEKKKDSVHRSDTHNYTGTKVRNLKAEREKKNKHALAKQHEMREHFNK